MTTIEIVDIAIIGGGPVGLFTAFYAGLRQASVKIIESLPQLGGQPGMLYPEKMVYDIPAYPEILAGDLVENLIKQLDRFEATQICLEEEALQIENMKTSMKLQLLNKNTLQERLLLHVETELSVLVN